MTDRRSGHDSLLSTGAAIIGLLTGFGVVVLVAHDRGAATAGVVFGAVGLFTILATAAKLGTETTFVYCAGRLRGADRLDRHSLLRLLRLGALAPMSVAAVISALLLVLADPLAALLIDAEHEDAYATALRVLAPFVPVWVAGLGLLGITRGLGDMTPTALGQQVVQPTLQLVLVAISLMADLGVGWIAFAWALPLTTTLAIAAQRVRRSLRSPSIDTGSADEPWPSRREFWGHAGPRGLAGTLSMMTERLGVVLVGAFGGAALAGAWTAITRLLGVCFRMVHAMSQALNTRLPALLAAGRDVDAMDHARRTTWWTMALLTPVLVIASVFPGPALSLFDMHEVDGALAALQVAVAAAAITVVFAHADNVLLMSGRSMLVMIDGLPALAALIALSALLLGPLGLPGAAIAWTASAAIYRGLAVWQVRQRYGSLICSSHVPYILGLLAANLGAAFATRATLGSNVGAAVIAGGLCAGTAAAAVEWTRRRSDAPIAGDTAEMVAADA